jgi:stearoyl-CoA desaturase (delta-9 desaturase)
MFGDGWHNNHHYCPSSARMGFRWWEFDLNYGLLRLLERFGIVWDLRAPPEATARRRREAASAQAEAPRQRTDV